MNDDSKKNQIAIREEVNLDMVMKDIDAMQRMSAQLMKTKHYQAMGEAGIFAIVQKAKSLGVSPLEALNGGLYYLQGKTGMSSEMMNSLIRQAGHSITKDAKSNNEICILHGKRSDNGDTWTTTFSMDDAKRAGLAKNMYDKYPGVMIFNRCLSMLARQLFPDVIKGCSYDMSELKEIAANKASSQPEMEMVEVEKVIITKEQVNKLLDCLKRCPEDFVERVLNHINKLAGSIHDLEVKDYGPIMERVEEKLSEVVVEVKNELSS